MSLFIRVTAVSYIAGMTSRASPRAVCSFLQAFKLHCRASCGYICKYIQNKTQLCVQIKYIFTDLQLLPQTVSPFLGVEFVSSSLLME